jgi:branched-chain amino acid transport system ATP-binding protein
MNDEIMLSARGVNSFYGASQILFGLNLEVRRGQVMALLGRNGAGKSTTFKTLMGLVPPRAGEIMLQGKPIHGLEPHRIARRGLGFVPEDRQVFTHHTVHDNLEIAVKKGPDGSRYWTLEKLYEAFPILAERRNRIAGKMSGGEQQMLSMARTMAGNPTMLLLDEPSEGLAPIIVAQIADLILQLRAAGSTILLAEQNMQFCLKVATHVSIIDKGAVVYVSTIDDFRADDTIKSKYLTT